MKDNKIIKVSKEFNEEKNSKQIQVLKMPNIKKINKIESNAKDVLFSLNNKNELKLILDKGPVHRKELISGEILPEEKKEITGHNSKEYNQDGFSGTLEKYVYSGSYTPEDTKYVSGQSSSNYNRGGYKGTLSRYLYSGSYTPSDTKTVSTSKSSGYSRDQILQNSSLINGMDTYYYSSGGYSGTLNLTSSSGDSNVTLHYSGTVTRPSSDTRVYKYRGNVTRPESDTRVYKYKGTVTKPGKDTRKYQEYYKYKVDIEYEEAENKNITLQDNKGNILFPKSNLNNISDIKIENNFLFFYYENKWIELKNK